MWASWINPTVFVDGYWLHICAQMVCRYISMPKKVVDTGQLQGSYGTGDSPPVQDKGKVLFIVLVVSKVNYGKDQRI